MTRYSEEIRSAKRQRTCLIANHDPWVESESSWGPVPNPSANGTLETLADASAVHAELQQAFSNQKQFDIVGTNTAKEDATICFGMVVDIPVHTLRSSTIIHEPFPTAGFLHPDRTIVRTSDNANVGLLNDHASKCLFKLVEDGGADIQLMLNYTSSSSKRQRGQIIVTASAILYGLDSLIDDIGDFVFKCGYTLQEPSYCNRNVLYRNPHCLASLYCDPPMTFSLQKAYLQPSSQVFLTPLGILEDFETTEVLPLSATPSSIRTTLHRHQQQALSFLLQRESGGNITGISRGLWTQEVNSSGSLLYTNTISGRQQREMPPPWRGGLLADEMGLGKTLSMMSLIASNKDNEVPYTLSNGLQLQLLPIPSTLIIVPPPIIQVWEGQLTTHLFPGKITWIRHHGKQRFDPFSTGQAPDIVITTYQTIQNEYKKAGSSTASIFACHWRRIVLDEAHIIRNRTGTFKAISSLNASCRWAITGTPIQNSLSDFANLLGFLQFHPYSDPKVFDDDIINLMRENNIDGAKERIKALCTCIMLRRSKATIELPEREDRLIRIPFSAEEERYYRNLETVLQRTPDEAIEAHVSTGRLWMSTIQLINKLRIVCNLGITPAAMPKEENSPAVLSVLEDDPNQTIVASRLSMGGAPCEQCLQIIDPSDAAISSENAHPRPYAYYSECRLLYCSSCTALAKYQASTSCTCVDFTKCLLRPIHPGLLGRPLTGGRISPAQDPGFQTAIISSKVRAVVAEILQGLPEKSVIFSFWISCLDMVQRALENAGIRCVRIDGNFSASNRQRALDQLKNDDATKVILITISCGGVGLDLTAASLVHLLEPQWNPAVEDQALARVHRMGQIRRVTTIRYVMKDSFEEDVISVQDRKKLLADLLLSPDSSQ